MAVTSTPLVDSLVNQAKTLPQLVTTLQMVDPTLAASMESKPLIASKTPWGVLVATGVTWVSTKYGLSWDDTTCSLVAGAVIVGASYVMRYLSPQYVKGIFSTPSAPPTVPNPSTGA